MAVPYAVDRRVSDGETEKSVACPPTIEVMNGDNDTGDWRRDTSCCGRSLEVTPGIARMKMRSSGGDVGDVGQT